VIPALSNLTLCRTTEESRLINAARHRAIIIAGSGMCSGGRILHHLRHNLWRPECHVVIASFQAPGTLGRALVDAARHVHIYGEEVRVAAKIHTLGGLSAHGDRDDLLRWYTSFSHRPPVCLVHGEPAPAASFAASLGASGTSVRIAVSGERIDLARLASAPPQ
jgi:metallo-beta-lactamase family protein